jgi:hypothetical protein
VFVVVPEEEDAAPVSHCHPQLCRRLRVLLLRLLLLMRTAQKKRISLHPQLKPTRALSLANGPTKNNTHNNPTRIAQTKQKQQTNSSSSSKTARRTMATWCCATRG